MPIPSALRPLAAAGLLLASLPSFAEVALEESPHLEKIPSFLSCDVMVTPANFTTMLAQVNDPTKRVFCVQPGDYRSYGEVILLTSGTQANRRFLRFDSHDLKTNAVQRPERAIFEKLNIAANWWVIQGLTVQPRNGMTNWFIDIYGGDHVILDGNLVDGIDQAPTNTTQDAIVIAALNGDPATYNSVQRNVVRNGDQTLRPGDFEGISIAWGKTASETNDFNKVLDNEIYDWGDGIQVSGHTTDCSEPGVQHGTIIDGNDVYLTANKRIDCNTGVLDPSGECACAENGIDVKLDPGSSPANWTKITNNRLWGFRPTSTTVSCGGSGANGQALTAGNSCSAHVLAARNVISDSTQGIVAERSWIVAGNLIDNIRVSDGHVCCVTALLPAPTASDVAIQFNTIVDVDAAYDDLSSNTDMRCNAIINNLGLKPETPGNPTNVTTYNYLYNSSTDNFSGPTNRLYMSAAQSNNADYCYWRKRWTAPELVCIPLGSTTAASPHVAAVPHCDPDLAAAFGIQPITYPTAQPCSDGVDDDGDGLVDFPADPGCADATSVREDPQCQNGRDDDGNGLVDFDGGASANGGVALASPDPGCKSLHGNLETSTCGLGAELVFVMWALRRLRRRH